MSTERGHKRKFIQTDDCPSNACKRFRLSSPTQLSNLSTFQTISHSGIPVTPVTPSSYPNRAKWIIPAPQPFAPSGFSTAYTPKSPDLQFSIPQSRPKFKAKLHCNRNSGKSITLHSSMSSFDPRPSVDLNESWRFVARPCPDFSKKFELKKAEFTPTVPRPPVLETSLRTRECSLGDRGGFKQDSRAGDWGSPVREEGRFFAKPMPSFDKVFVPVMDYVPVQPMDIELNTQRRAAEREKFKGILKDKENIANEIKVIEAEVEAEEVRAYRKTLEFKARPLQELRPFLVRRSEEELTAPRSPMLRTKARALSRVSAEIDNRMDID